MGKNGILFLIGLLSLTALVESFSLNETELIDLNQVGNGLVPTAPSNESHATQALNETAAKTLSEEMNDLFWTSATAYRRFADDSLSPEILMREKLRAFYPKMQAFQWKNFTNLFLKRQFEVILRGTAYPPMEYKFKKATRTLKCMAKERYVCPRNETKKCKMAYVHHIKSFLTSSDDLDSIKHYWKEWRNKMPVNIKESLRFYVDYYQKLGTSELKPSAIWYDQYEDPKFLAELEQLIVAIAPLYKQLHAHIRQILKMEYGDNVIPESGLIPHHLLEQLTYQAWKKHSILKNPFPLRKLPNLQNDMDHNHMKSLDLVNMSAIFFGTLGFQNLSETFMSKHFSEIPLGSAGPDCKSRIFDFGEVELNYCPKVYFKKLLQTHGDLAHIYYALAKNNLPVGLNQEACPGFGNSIGEAVILSVSTPKHLQTCLGLLQEYNYDDFLTLNRLYRMAVHTLLTLPTYYVHEKLWIDMIDGHIEPDEYNCHFWNLMQMYMGVEAPVATNPDAYDMPYKFYEGIVEQTRSTKKLFGEFLGYQIYREICLAIGQYEPDNVLRRLDNCDFCDNKKSGEMLSEMMFAGSTKPWREIIAPVTNRTRLSATGFLEYFKPLYNWLRTDNLNKNLQIGWSIKDKCGKPSKVTSAQ